jgi:hypothetical protein
MAGGLEVDIDDAGIKALINVFGATEKQVQAALRSTYGKMARWLRTRAVRGLSSELAIKQKVLRARVKTFRLQGGIASGGQGMKVWFGLKPISLMRLNAKKTADGVSADGGRFVKGAFIATYNGRRTVLKRAGAARLPLVVQSADISDKAVVYVEDILIGTAEFDLMFFKIFEHELKWRTTTTSRR